MFKNRNCATKHPNYSQVTAMLLLTPTSNVCCTIMKFSNKKLARLNSIICITATK